MAPCLMVILGAGASYDSTWRRSVENSSGPADARLPLAKDLFHLVYGPVAAKHPPSGGLMRRLRDAAERVPPEIEPELQAIRAESATRPYLRRQLLGVQYYIRDVISQAQQDVLRVVSDHVTNYVELVHEIERWRLATSGTVCFVSFNYDTLLEKAVRGVLPGFTLINITNYIGDDRYKIVKLHGSIDWMEALPTPERGWVNPPRLADLDSVWDADRSGQYVTAYQAGQMEGRFLPAIALPTASKTPADFACPPEHVEELRRQIAKVTHLLVIGWRGAEDNLDRVWQEESEKLWGGASERVGVVGTSKDKIHEIEERIGRGLSIKGAAWKDYEGGFGKFIETFEIRNFLA